MATYARSATTTAPPERVWQIWSDPSTWKEWNPSVAEMTMNGPFAVGATGTMTTPQGRKHDMTVMAVDPGRSFSMQTGVLPLSTFLFRCSVAPSGGGSTIEQTIEVLGPLAVFYGPLMGNAMAGSFVPVLEGLRSYAEGAA